MRHAPKRIEMIDDQMAEILRQKTPQQRLAMAHSMWDFAKGLIRANLIRQHPDWTPEQIQAETARRLSHGAV